MTHEVPHRESTAKFQILASSFLKNGFFIASLLRHVFLVITRTCTCSIDDVDAAEAFFSAMKNAIEVKWAARGTSNAAAATHSSVIEYRVVRTSPLQH